MPRQRRVSKKREVKNSRFTDSCEEETNVKETIVSFIALVLLVGCKSFCLFYATSLMVTIW